MVASARLETIAQEQVTAMLAELRELGVGERYAASARRALLEDFLPRYLRLALEQNALEEQGWKSWRGGDPLGRVLSGVGVLVLALTLSRFIRNPVILVVFAAALMVPFAPELRSFWYRWQYQRGLQSVVDDVSRQQAELDALPEVDLARELDPVRGRLEQGVEEDNEPPKPRRPTPDREPT